MKKIVTGTIVILIGCTVIAAAIVLVHHRKSQLATLSTPKIRPIPVHLKTAISGTLPVIEHYLGTIEPVVDAVLSAQATGYLISIHKDVGDRLAAGEPVAEIDNRLPLQQKNVLEAEFKGAKEDFEIKKIMLKRRQELVKSKTISKELLNEAELAYEMAFSRMQRLKQELEAANVSLSFTRIQALFDGVITERMKDIGDLVMPGTPVFRAENTSRGYKVIVHVPQETATRLSGNSPLKLVQGDKTINTTVYRVYPAVITGSLVTVEVRLDERPFGLPSYGTVGVDLVVGMPEGLVVSSDCVLEQETGAQVFVVEDKQNIRPVSVKILGRGQKQAVVEGDLDAGASLAAGPESMLLQLSRHGRIVPVSEGEK
jgi:RND family efflux transporter MFP subunit